MTEPTLGPGWGRKFLLRCAVDPDDPAAVRAVYESCRASHAKWPWTLEGEMDGETCYMLVDAIKDLYGWERFPWDWPPPILVRMSRPFRNIIPRIKPTETT
jgi:hypothetical protein